MAATAVSDIIVPASWDPYMRRLTVDSWNLMQAGVIVESPGINVKLAGGGNTFERPSWQDLDGTSAEQLATDDSTEAAVNAVSTFQETIVRLSRTKAWAWANLATTLAGDDPASFVASRVAVYWQRRWQEVLISMLIGIFAANDAAAAGSDTHTAGDLTFDGSNGGVFSAGLSTISASKVIDALGTMGQNDDSITTMFAHSIVRDRMRKENLIEVVRDSDTNLDIEFYAGKRLFVNDNLTNAAGIYETWFFGPGAFEMGAIAPPDRAGTVLLDLPLQGTGMGVEGLLTRWVFAIHPVGYVYAGTATGAGPTNAVLDDAASWSRRTPERGQVAIARLKTTETA